MVCADSQRFYQISNNSFVVKKCVQTSTETEFLKTQPTSLVSIHMLSV